MDKRTCSVDFCEDPARGRWCTRHHYLWKKYGNPLGGPYGGRRRTDPRRCNIEGCPDPHYGLGWCQGHWTNWRRHGDPEWTPGTQHRKYALDDSFFDVIDTEAKAYWLGFITADGWVLSGPQSGTAWSVSRVSVKLKASDAGHLVKLKADMSAESPVLPVPQRTSGKPAVQITLSSVHLVASLIRLGVTPRKSLTVEPWSGPAHLMRHYWRGMVDGDGTILRHAGERDKWQVKLIGTKACVAAFASWAAPVCGSAAKPIPKVNIWSWTAGGLASPQALARELYGGSTVYLDRKHELAQQLMAVPPRHRTWLRPLAV